MALTKKHFVKVAAIIAAERKLARHAHQHDPVGSEAVLAATRNITLSLGDMFTSENLSFDRQRFYEAAGVPEPYSALGETVDDLRPPLALSAFLPRPRVAVEAQ